MTPRRLLLPSILRNARIVIEEKGELSYVERTVPVGAISTRVVGRLRGMLYLACLGLA
jgi:hypothetical protein